MLPTFVESIGIMESNEVELLAIPRAIHLWIRHGNDNLVLEGDSTNASTWAIGRKSPRWMLVNIDREIKKLRVGIQIMRSSLIKLNPIYR